MEEREEARGRAETELAPAEHQPEHPSACFLSPSLRHPPNMTATYPEQYPLEPTINVPNNPLPALVYRNVLPAPLDSESAKQLCESHGWEKRVSFHLLYAQNLSDVTGRMGRYNCSTLPSKHP
jgi:hypothetical protein